MLGPRLREKFTVLFLIRQVGCERKTLGQAKFRLARSVANLIVLDAIESETFNFLGPGHSEIGKWLLSY